MFVNRNKELNQLNEIHDFARNNLMVVAISGLRRVGKTTLVKEFLKGKKGIYFFVFESKNSTELLHEFTEELKREKIATEFEKFESWHQFFKALFERSGERVIVFDEFQNFFSIDRAVFSILQKYCDEFKNKPNQMILLGSLIGLFKKTFEDKKQPLYGRIDVKINLQPFSLDHSLEMLKLQKFDSFENMLLIYGIFGGFPKYYDAISKFNLQNKSVFEIIDNFFIQQNAPFENEVNDILKQEFGKKSQIYYSILNAIADGKTKLNEIATTVGMKDSSITKQLQQLEEKYGLITALKPIDSKKNTRYELSHPLIKFWFRFIFEKFSQYNLRNEANILKNITSQYNSFFGYRFEEICKQVLMQLNYEKQLPFEIKYLSNWWGHTRANEGKRETIEIDLLAANNSTKDIIFVECKWQDEVNAQQIAKELHEKTKHVKWHNSERKEILIIFAKKFAKRINEFEGKEVKCYDLTDIEKILASPTKM